MLHSLLDNGRGVKVITAVATILSVILAGLVYTNWRRLQDERPWEPITSWTSPMPVTIDDGQITLGGEVCNKESYDVTSLITIVWESEETTFVQFDRAPYRFPPGCSPLSRDSFPVAQEATPGRWQIETLAQPVARPNNSAPAETITASSEPFEISR